MNMTPKTFKFINAARSKDRTRPHLCQIAIMENDSAAATDGHRLHWVGDLSNPIARSEAKTAKLFNAEEHIPMDHLSSHGIVFPPYAQVVPETFKAKIHLSPKDLEAFEGITDVEAVVISKLDHRSLEFTAEHSFFGHLRTTVEIFSDIQGDFEPFGISTEYLHDAIKNMIGIEINIGGPLDPILVDGVVGGDHCHAVIMPRRI